MFESNVRIYEASVAANTKEETTKLSYILEGSQVGELQLKVDTTFIHVDPSSESSQDLLHTIAEFYYPAWLPAS
jgi:hypothetical protein